MDTKEQLSEAEGMLDVSELRKIFADKLAATDSLDAAFLKAVWVAFKRGIAVTDNNQLLAALTALVDEPQPLGTDRPAYQAALALVNRLGVEGETRGAQENSWCSKERPCTNCYTGLGPCTGPWETTA